LRALHAARLTRRPCHRFQDLLRGFVGAPRAIPGSVAAGPSSDSLNLPRVCAIRADAVRGWMTREGPIAEGRNDAEAEELGDGDPRHGAAGGRLRDPVAARGRLRHQAEDDERSAPSSQGAREVAPWRSRSSTEGGRREDGAQEEGRRDARGPEGEDRSPPSQASAWSWASSGLEEESGLMANPEGGRLCTAIVFGLIAAPRLANAMCFPYPIVHGSGRGCGRAEGEGAGAGRLAGWLTRGLCPPSARAASGCYGHCRYRPGTSVTDQTGSMGDTPLSCPPGGGHGVEETDPMKERLHFVTD